MTDKEWEAKMEDPIYKEWEALNFKICNEGFADGVLYSDYQPIRDSDPRFELLVDTFASAYSELQEYLDEKFEEMEIEGV